MTLAHPKQAEQIAKTTESLGLTKASNSHVDSIFGY